MIFTLRTRLF